MENVSILGLVTSCGVKETVQPVADIVVLTVETAVELFATGCDASHENPGAEAGTDDIPALP